MVNEFSATSWAGEALQCAVTCMEASPDGARRFARTLLVLRALREETLGAHRSIEQGWVEWRLAEPSPVDGYAGYGRWRRLNAAIGSLSVGDGPSVALARVAVADLRRALWATINLGDLAPSLRFASDLAQQVELPQDVRNALRLSPRDVASLSSDEGAWRCTVSALAALGEAARPEASPALRDKVQRAAANCRACLAEVGEYRAAASQSPGGLIEAFAEGAEHEALLGDPAADPRAARGIEIADAARARAGQGSLPLVVGALRRSAVYEGPGGEYVDLLPATAATFGALVAHARWSFAGRHPPPPGEVVAIARAAEELLRGFGLCRDVNPVPLEESAPAADVLWPDEGVEDAFTALALTAARRGWRLAVRGGAA